MVADEFKTIDRYETVELLGRGGMGSVYLARDPLIDRLVAVKLLDAAFDASARGRFSREARAAGRLHHPNIVTIFDVGEHLGRPFIAMEYVPGLTLAALIREAQTLPGEKLRLMADAAAALAFAHRAGVVHLDVKPENLMRRDDGVLKILDFGIARMLTAETTHTHRVLGTLRYMAPEQVTGDSVDRRSDVFALGCVLYELVAGRPAFEGTMKELLARVSQPTHVTPLPDLVPDAPPELARMVERAMAQNPDDRYDDLDLLRRELDAVRDRLGVVLDGRLQPVARAIDTSDQPTREATTRGPEIDRQRSVSRRPPVQADLAAVGSGRVSNRRPVTALAFAIGLVALIIGMLWLRTNTGGPNGQGSVEQVATPPLQPADAVPLQGLQPPTDQSNVGGSREADAQVSQSVARGTRERPLEPSREQPRSVNDDRSEALTGRAAAQSVPEPAPTAIAPLPSAVPAPPPPPAPVPASPPGDRDRAADSTPVVSDGARLTTQDKPPEKSAAEDVRAALSAYEAAYDGLNVAALRRVAPGLSAEQLEAVGRTFANAVSYDVDLQVLGMDIMGSTAVVTCLVTHAFVPKIGSPSRNPPLQIRFSLRETQAGWVIDRVEPAQARR